MCVPISYGSRPPSLVTYNWTNSINLFPNLEDETYTHVILLYSTSSITCNPLIAHVLLLTTPLPLFMK